MCRSWLASEGALQGDAGLKGLFAGKRNAARPAPTAFAGAIKNADAVLAVGVQTLKGFVASVA
ncbi:hypothetical protein BLX41_13390 [Pseudomonas protegens]|nr:hypothetical protein BLX41_13390 [Pseudomonas protegens]